MHFKSNKFRFLQHFYALLQVATNVHELIRVFQIHSLCMLCCSSCVSQIHSWHFVLGERESEAGLDRPGHAAEHLTAARYAVQHTVWGNTHTLAEAELGYVETKLKMIIILLKILKIGQQQQTDMNLEVSVPRSLSVHFTASLFLLKLKHWFIGISLQNDSGCQALTVLVRCSVKLFSRFGLFLGRTDTRYHRRVL